MSIPAIKKIMIYHAQREGCISAISHLDVCFFLIKIEEEELEEFELLEQAAANTSFSSNSSVVVKVLAKARDKAQDGKHVCQGQSVTNNRGTECLSI